MPPDLSDIIWIIPSYATTLQLSPSRSNFRDTPAFIHTFFQDQQAAFNSFDYQKTANAYPTINILPTMALLPLLPSLIQGLWIALVLHHQEFHQQAPMLQSTLHQLHSIITVQFIHLSPTAMTQTYNLPTSFLDTFDQLTGIFTTIALPFQWLHYLGLCNSSAVFPIIESCFHLSSDLCDLLRLISKLPPTNGYPCWKQPILLHHYTGLPVVSTFSRTH